MAVNLGLLDPSRGRRAMRWVESQYGFGGTRPDVRLTMTSDLWPIRWSNQYVSVGDMFLDALAGMKSGDVDQWWPYVTTAIQSSFRAVVPGIHYGITTAGMGTGDLEDVDTDDTPTHMVARGLFGIEPALHEARIDICPAFPAGWKQASIKTPDISYDYQREDDELTFHIHTPTPLIKHVRANLTGAEVITPAETDSVVKVKVGPALPELPKPTHLPSILADQPPAAGPILNEAQKQRLVLIDLSSTYNITQEQLMATPFLFDDRQTPMPAKDWWVNPSLKLPPNSPREISTGEGIRFLTAGRPEGIDASTAPKSLLALSSWKPYPWPAGARIPVARKCERLWLLLQNYVHPSKCYVPNGEVVLRYADGTTTTTSLIPPYNMDCFYQRFSREGETVPLGEFDNWPPKNGYSPATVGAAEKYTVCHANALGITCDPHRQLESIELRATCAEGILGLAGMTILPAEATR